jgi:hypothetical protein
MIAISRNLLRFLGFTLMLCCASAAFAGDPFPGQTPDKRLIRTQQKVDKLFEKGDYERAMFIYCKELAPVGDKFAQYMVGYMHNSGHGIAEDHVTASAWYRLAAERGEESYVRVRDVLLGSFDDEQRSRSDVLYATLRGEMGDVTLISRLIEEDLLLLRGGRGNEAFLPQDFEGLNFSQSGSDDQSAVYRLNQRSSYLINLLASDKSASEQEREQGRALTDRVRQEIDLFEASSK